AGRLIVRIELTKQSPNPLIEFIFGPRGSSNRTHSLEDRRQVVNGLPVFSQQIEQPNTIIFRPIGTTKQNPKGEDAAANFKWWQVHDRLHQRSAASSSTCYARKLEAAPRAVMDGVAVAGSAIVFVGLDRCSRQLPVIVVNSILAESGRLAYLSHAAWLL